MLKLLTITSILISSSLFAEKNYIAKTLPISSKVTKALKINDSYKDNKNFKNYKVTEFPTAYGSWKVVTDKPVFII